MPRARRGEHPLETMRAALRRLKPNEQLSLLALQVQEGCTLGATALQTRAAQLGIVLSQDTAAVLARTAILTYERVMQRGELAR